MGAIVVIAVAVFVLTRDKPGTAYADQGNAHLGAEPNSYIWNTRPPTSGPHAPQIAPWGVHEDTVPEWYQVHNLEDGGVIIHYNCPDGCDELVSQLRGVVEEVGEEQLILQPYANMDSRIALTAWTRLQTLDEFDHDTIVDFVKAYRGVDHHR